MPSIYRPMLSIHFFSENSIGVDTWRNYADTWLGGRYLAGVDTWPVTSRLGVCKSIGQPTTLKKNDLMRLTILMLNPN